MKIMRFMTPIPESSGPPSMRMTRKVLVGLEIYNERMRKTIVDLRDFRFMWFLSTCWGVLSHVTGPYLVCKMHDDGKTGGHQWLTTRVNFILCDLRTTSQDDMSDDPAKFIRSTSDTSAPSTPPPVLYKLFTTARLLIFLPLLAPLLAYTTLKRLFRGPRLPWMSLSTELLVVTIQAYLQTSFYLPQVDKLEMEVAKGLPGWQKARKDVDCVKIMLEPAGEEYRLGIGRVEGVKGVRRPAWMLTPPGAIGQGLEKARDGEKIVMYIPGG
jgi:hypothetical protein